MSRSKTSKFVILAAVCLLSAGVSITAKAGTVKVFHVEGSFADEGIILAPSPIPLSGTLKVDLTGGSVVDANIMVEPFQHFRAVTNQTFNSYHYDITLSDNSSEILFIDFINYPTGNSLVWFTSGTIIAGSVFSGASIIPIYASLSGTITGPGGAITGPLAVPEPSAWAMMLIGFAGIGFAGYRRARAGHATLAA